MKKLIVQLAGYEELKAEVSHLKQLTMKEVNYEAKEHSSKGTY